MNERIKELEKQADEYFDDLSIEFSREAWMEKFAELIVRECIQQCLNVEEDGELYKEPGTFADGALLCREEIKAHFGVEDVN